MQISSLSFARNEIALSVFNLQELIAIFASCCQLTIVSSFVFFTFNNFLRFSLQEAQHTRHCEIKSQETRNKKLVLSSDFANENEIHIESNRERGKYRDILTDLHVYVQCTCLWMWHVINSNGEKIISIPLKQATRTRRHDAICVNLENWHHNKFQKTNERNDKSSKLNLWQRWGECIVHK